LIDRRAVFFVCSAVVCAALAPVTPRDVRWVGNVMAIGFVVLALASWLDFASRRRGHR
jgi:hypothetical protein